MYQKTEDGSRSYNKNLACYFCNKLYKQKIKRHLQTVHAKEPEIESLATKSVAEQKHRFDELKIRGNFNHNLRVLEEGVGELIVLRRPTARANIDDYLPCIYCLGFLQAKDLFVHTKTCEHNKSKTDENTKDGGEADNKNVLGKSRMLLAGALQQDYADMSDEFRSDVFNSMRYDAITKYVKTDFLILKYGMSLYRRHGRSRHNDISQKMRSLARLVLMMREMNSVDASASLQTILNGGCFDAVLKATEAICKLEANELGKPQFKNPSFGIRVGHMLVKAAELKKGLGIRTSCSIMISDADHFLALHKNEWTNVIASTASSTLKHRRYNNPEVLPVTSDLLKLKKFQEKVMASLTPLLLTKPTYTTWRQLLEIVYSRVVVFNKRRCGETAKLLVSAFKNRPSWKDNVNDEIIGTLQPMEQQLMLRYVQCFYF